MWPYLVAAGIISLIVKAFTEDDEKETCISEKEKKIFISFAIEDEKYRDYLVEQAKNEKSPFSFIDKSVRTPWNEKEWKEKCRIQIKECDGMIVMLSQNTYKSSGVKWEIKCANEEGINVIGMHIKKNNKGFILPELKGKKIIEWKWDSLSNSINEI